VTFLDVETWTRLAVYTDSNFSKGKGIRIVGRLKQDRWEDKEGNPRSRLKLVADYVEKRPTFSKEVLGDEDDEGAEESVDTVEAESAVETVETEPVV